MIKYKFEGIFDKYEILFSVYYPCYYINRKNRSANV